MALQHKGHLAFHYEKYTWRLESLFIYDVWSWVMLSFEKWSYPRDEIVMLLIVQIQLKELDLLEFLHRHLILQLDALAIWYFH
jgi:hypothetical protein